MSARIVNHFGRRASNASSNGSGGWGEDHVHSDVGEDGDAEDETDGETNDVSDQIKASLSLGRIDPGSNENVNVIGPDEKGDLLGKGDISSTPDISLTGTSKSSMKRKTAFSSLATSILKQKAVSRERSGDLEQHVAADDDSVLNIPGYFHGGKVPWRHRPHRRNTWLDKLFGS